MVIHDNLLPHSVQTQGYTVTAAFLDLSSQKQFLDAVLSLGYGGDTTQEVTIANFALKDVLWINIPLENMILLAWENGSGSFPFVSPESIHGVPDSFTESQNTAEVWFEVLVHEHTMLRIESVL
jgi:hypothetical protein